MINSKTLYPLWQITDHYIFRFIGICCDAPVFEIFDLCHFYECFFLFCLIYSMYGAIKGVRMKKLLLLSLLIASPFASASDILDRCRDAALATGYVYENILTVSVNTERMDKEDQEIFWTLLTDKSFEVIKHYPATYEYGDYFPLDTYIKFTFKLKRSRDAQENMDLESKQRSNIFYMQKIDGVKVDCAYIL